MGGFMRIAIVGIGGVGGYIGAKFCALQTMQPKASEVVFIARGSHADAIREQGIRVIEDKERFTAHPTEVCSAEAAQGSFDLVLLCVKSYDIEDAVMSLAHALRPDTVIIPFANGVDNARRVASLVDAKVLNGCVYILSHIAAPGVIRKEGNVFAASFGHPEYFGESLHVGYLFKDAGLRAKASEDIERDVWKKYLFISAFATLTSCYNMSIRSVAETHADVTRDVLNEIAAVAAAKGIDLSGEAEKAFASALKLPADASTSMHLDFKNRHRTELETLTGYVVAEAQRHAIDVPNMARMYTLLKENPYG